MHTYLAFVRNYPIASAMLQFAILGTLGDCLAVWLQNKRIFWAWSLKQFIWKPIVWAILAILIKLAFIGYNGFVDSLIDHHYLANIFTKPSFARAFAISVSMNLQFGFLLVIAHRILDYLPFGKTQWTNIHKAFYSLLWFWVPAHTITFMLPKDLQIGLAAVWSVALGLILGWFSLRNKKE